MVKKVVVRTPGQGLHEITREVVAAVGESGVGEGLCTVFIRHTSASLTIQENADPSARRDLERGWHGWRRRETRSSPIPPRGRTTCPRTSARR